MVFHPPHKHNLRLTHQAMPTLMRLPRTNVSSVSPRLEMSFCFHAGIWSFVENVPWVWSNLGLEARSLEEKTVQLKSTLPVPTVIQRLGPLLHLNLLSLVGPPPPVEKGGRRRPRDGTAPSVDSVC